LNDRSTGETPAFQPPTDAPPQTIPLPQATAREAAKTLAAVRDKSDLRARLEETEVRPIHWFPYDRAGVVNAVP
jgi:hypothetical protein